ENNTNNGDDENNKNANKIDSGGTQSKKDNSANEEKIVDAMARPAQAQVQVQAQRQAQNVVNREQEPRAYGLLVIIILSIIAAVFSIIIGVYKNRTPSVPSWASQVQCPKQDHFISVLQKV
ncbi:hypothetical protein RFI_38157, partial [Reticulomyxa filosa]